MATDNRRAKAKGPSVWECVEQERAGAKAAPFDDTVSVEAPGSKPAPSAEQAAWAADLAAVAEQRKRDVPKKVDSGGILDWDVAPTKALEEPPAPAPAPAAVEAAWAKQVQTAQMQRRSAGAPFGTFESPEKPAEPQAAEADKQAQWRKNLEAAQNGPRFARRYADVHQQPPTASGHVPDKPKEQAASRSKEEVVASLATEQRQRAADSQADAAVDERKASRTRLDVLAAPKAAYSPRGGRGETAGRRPSSAGSAASSSSAGSSRASRAMALERASRGPTVLQGKQAWKSVANAAKESVGAETWDGMSRAQKKELLRGAIAVSALPQPAAAPAGADESATDGVAADGAGDAQKDLDDASSQTSRSTRSSVRSSVRSSRRSESAASSARGSARGSGRAGSAALAESEAPAEAAEATSTPRSGSEASAKRTPQGVRDAHASSSWNFAEMHSATKDGEQDDRFVTATAASLRTAAVATEQESAPARAARDVHAASSWSFAEMFPGSGGDQGQRFVTASAAAATQPAPPPAKLEHAATTRTTKALQQSSWSLGGPDDGSGADDRFTTSSRQQAPPKAAAQAEQCVSPELLYCASWPRLTRVFCAQAVARAGPALSSCLSLVARLDSNGAPGNCLAGCDNGE